MLQRKRFFLVCLLLARNLVIWGLISRDTDQTNDLRYSVILSEPLESTLDWDSKKGDDATLILRWNITLSKGYSGILAFSNHDLDTDHLDVLIFGEDQKLYNAYTGETSGLSRPKESVELKYQLMEADNINNGKEKRFSIQIQRPLDTCDEKKRSYTIDRGTTHLLTGAMARGDFQKWKEGKKVKMTEKQMNLTLQRVQLLKSQVKFQPVDHDAPHLDFLNRKVLIPNVETTYWCTRFELPKKIMSKAHHIIRFDGVISPQSEGVVHHMELFHCDVDPNEEIPPYDKVCTSEQKPMGLTACRRVIGAWALGAANFTYPKEAGGVVGGPETSRYLVLEVHFNNPYLKKGIIDQSGIRIYYTPILRENDAAIMEVGLEYNPKNSIPPKAESFRLSGYCLSECTQASLPPAGITVFASQLHTHLTGVQVFTRIIKEDGTIVVLNSDRHYSPHFQEIRLLPEPVRIERGDVILHTCIYNTQLREGMTLGGYGISDEMCVNYMHYYPRSGLELCKTSVRDDALAGFFKMMNELDDAETSDRQTVIENYDSIRWTPITTNILETFYELAPIHLSCNGSDGNYSPRFNGTKLYRPQEPEQRDVPVDTAGDCE